MRYPVDNFKAEWNMTAGYGFGAVTSYGRHDGTDLNKNGGGDIELGAPIYAIANGKLVYYHTSSHPGKNFGYHTVYRIDGPWGVRWVHNAHMESDALIGVQDVKEGQRIGRVGKSGTQYAHDHFAIFKVDPAALRAGIDTVAQNDQELNAWWEDPIKFIEKWMNPQVSVDSKKFDELVAKSSNWDEVTKLGFFSVAALKQKLDEQKNHKCPVIDPRKEQALQQIQQIINSL